MAFVTVPDPLPAPQAYLRAGLPRPTAAVTSVREREHVVTSQDGLPRLDELSPDTAAGARTFTVVSDSGTPVAVVEGASHQFLTRPARRWAARAEILDVERHPSGVLDLTCGARRPPTHPERPDPVDPATARVVTVDHSVVLAGIDPSLFGPDDALFVSAVIPLELAVTLGSRPATEELFTAFETWDLTTPVPIDEYVLRIYAELSTSRRRNALRDGELDRSDLLCAATAVLYDAPLYTTKKAAYAGLGLGLRTIAYGPVRNEAAVTPPPPPDPYAALGLQPPPAGP
ncbi:hypothetical protein AB6N24_03365 [Cellulomonas sp. 179-A 4D5 NHS]|uniref:hypothetical protein n=1 Tax=Cellulomonas sp. 179-A 4D5 NHS TaxID=3142378 RepID=UPI0039A09BB5